MVLPAEQEEQQRRDPESKDWCCDGVSDEVDRVTCAVWALVANMAYMTAMVAPVTVPIRTAVLNVFRFSRTLAAQPFLPFPWFSGDMSPSPRMAFGPTPIPAAWGWSQSILARLDMSLTVVMGCVFWSFCIFLADWEGVHEQGALPDGMRPFFLSDVLVLLFFPQAPVVLLPPFLALLLPRNFQWAGLAS